MYMGHNVLAPLSGMYSWVFIHLCAMIEVNIALHRQEPDFMTFCVGREFNLVAVLFDMVCVFFPGIVGVMI